MGLLSSRIGQCLMFFSLFFSYHSTFRKQLIEQNAFYLKIIILWYIYTMKYVTLILLKHPPFLEVALEYSGAPAREVCAVEHHR